MGLKSPGLEPWSLKVKVEVSYNLFNGSFSSIFLNTKNVMSIVESHFYHCFIIKAEHNYFVFSSRTLLNFPHLNQILCMWWFNSWITNWQGKPVCIGTVFIYINIMEYIMSYIYCIKGLSEKGLSLNKLPEQL